MAKRLWDKGDALDSVVHAFTVGNDPEIDRQLVYWDALASAAHARMLAEVGLIGAADANALLEQLAQIATLGKNGNFPIPRELEDCHTAIEARLTEQLGDPGRKINTGRSRNDQVLVAMRLLIRDNLCRGLEHLADFVGCTLKRAESVGHLPMPGYTHLQAAMPASTAMWLLAFAEHGLEVLQAGLALYQGLNCNPLGAAAGFGTPLPINRELTARLLGFNRVQRNPINIQNSRGRYELQYLRWVVDAASISEKLAWDCELFSTSEFGLLKLPVEFTTGSSIMPQKRNADVAELLRARTARLRGLEDELRWVTSKLPSSYHRDYQYTKEPLIRAAAELDELLPVAALLVERLQFNEEVLKTSLSPELVATYDAYRRVRAGVAFRQAYQQSAVALQAGEIEAGNYAQEFKAVTASIDQELVAAKAELDSILKLLQTLRTSTSNALERLFISI